MKAINQKAQKILETLISKMEEGYAKIDNSQGCFMPVVVEDIGSNMISVAHYFEQNGDLIPDPEMIFWKGADGRFYPTYLKNVFGDHFSLFFKDGKPSRIWPHLQHDQATFAGQWMLNIKAQQGL